MESGTVEYLRDELRAVVEGRQERIHVDWKQAGDILAAYDQLRRKYDEVVKAARWVLEQDLTDADRAEYKGYRLAVTIGDAGQERHEYHNGQGPEFAHLPCRECGRLAGDPIHE